MRFSHATLIALMAGLLLYSPVLSARDDPASIYQDTGMGRWSEADELQGQPMRIQHGPLTSLDPADALLVVGPRTGYSSEEAAALQRFLHAGGRALVADATGTARQLLADVPVDILEAQVYSTSYVRSPAWPLLESESLPETVLSRPHVVAGDGEVLLAAHPFSWQDLDNDLEPDLDEPIGAWPVAMKVRIGAGELIVVGDDGLFFQDVSAPTAEALLAWLVEGRTVVVDEGHRARADPVGATPVLSGARPATAAVLATIVVLAVFAWDLDWRIRRVKPRPKRIIRDDPVLDELPDGY